MYRSATYDFLLTFNSNQYVDYCRLSRTVSEINGDYSRKSENFPNLTRVFCAAVEGVPIGIGYRRWSSKKLE